MAPTLRPVNARYDRSMPIARVAASDQRSKLVRRLALALPIVGLALWMTSQPSHAETPATPVQVVAAAAGQQETFHIPAGQLPAALEIFAKVAGVQISYDRQKVQGLTTGGLKGTYDIQAGLDKLLEGTGYVSERTGSGYTLVAAPPAAASLPQPAELARR